MSEEQIKSYYAIIPANVRYDSDLPPNAKLLYGEITALTNDKGYCWASNNYFANLYGVYPTTISKWLRVLKEKNYITIELVYKEGTKEIQNRHIKISEIPIANLNNTYCQKEQEGMEQKNNTPIVKKSKENNTSINNTFNNTYEIYSPDKSELDVIPYKEVCEYLNNRTGSNYKHTTRKTKDLIRARFNEGFTLEDFEVVIDKKCVEWMNTDMQKYLRPETLFGTKFEGYLNQQAKERKLTTKDIQDKIDFSDF